MKIKGITLLAVAAIVAVSFSLISVKRADPAPTPANTAQPVVQDEPAGGFVAEDKF